jgi:hypothetical protein
VGQELHNLSENLISLSAFKLVAMI